MLVSVVITTYNRSALIGGSVESALRQTHGEIEVIVVDDGSTDDTESALKDHMGRINFVRQKNAGPSAARNRGVAESKGDIIAFLDSDDHWLPDKISRQVALLDRGGPEMSCCVCNAEVRTPGGGSSMNTFDSADLKMSFNEGTWTNPQTVLATRFLLFNQVLAVRRKAFDLVGGFNEKLRLLEDFELSLKLSAVGKWGVIRDPLVVKYNDENGIGVQAMSDHEKHVSVCIDVIEGILSSADYLGPRAHGLLDRGLADLRSESRVIAMSKNGGITAALGKATGLFLRGRKALRRRLSSWPEFEGESLE
jgi:glycosyltransferase involved in cell wall biosynthesis